MYLCYHDSWEVKNMKFIKEKFNVHRAVWFMLISAMFLLFYAPHLSFDVHMDEGMKGTVIVSNFNTDRGEEIFANYNYNSHKTWIDAEPWYEVIHLSNIPIVTNSLRLGFNNVQSNLTISKIDVSFGPFKLAEYTPDNISGKVIASQAITINTSDNKISLAMSGVEGWIQFQEQEYLPKTVWIAVYGIILLLSWIIAYLIDKLIPWAKHIPQNEIMLIAAPIWCFFMSEICTGNYYYINTMNRFYNVAIYIVLYKIIYLLFRRLPVSVLISNLFVVIFGIVNMYVTQFRNRPIAPWDLTAISTAADVLSNYHVQLRYYMVIALIIAVLIYLLMRAVPRDKTKINIYYAAYPILIIVVALFLNSVGQYYLWDMNLLSIFQTDGTALSFTGLVNQYISDQPKKPENYSTSELEQLGKELQQRAIANVAPNVTQPTNIIMVMNESFADMNIGGTNYADNIIPYYLSLDNTIRGNLYVDVRGGGTCNSEYESLTGNTTAFFAGGVYPFNMYMHRKVPSMISYFNDIGYTTTGIHLGKSTNWNRATAWNRLQYQNKVFAETFDGLETIHGYPTDAQNFKVLEENYEKEKDKKNFIFNITYQNHGGYDNKDDLVQTVDFSSLGDQYDHAENYLSLMKISDQDYKNLIEYFSNVKEPTMIIMFGDHQPSLGADSDNLLFPNAGTPEADMTQYITPFSIWANYDIPDQKYDKLSINYLSSLIMKTANFQMTPYQEFLYELKDKYPVIGLYGCYDAEGNYYQSVNDLHDKDIDTYRNLQYNNVFDSNRIDSLFYPETK